MDFTRTELPDTIDASELQGKSQRELAHFALDKIFDDWESSDSFGGSAELGGTCAKGHQHTYRVTFAEITNTLPCAFCDGTGLVQGEPLEGH